MTMRRHALALLIAGTVWTALAVQAPLEAQEPPAPSAQSPTTTGFCYSSNPLPSCASYLIFEMTGAVRLAGTTRLYSIDPAYGACVGPGCRIDDLPSYLAWDVGLMRNRGSRYALGGSLQLGGNEDGVRVALRARSRIFLPHNGVVDVAAGPLAVRVGNSPNPHEAYGATADAAVGIRRIGVVLVGTDVTNDQSRIAAAMHGGLRLESIPAVIASALAAAGGIITLIALAHGQY